jgi:hypothetical protein
MAGSYRHLVDENNNLHDGDYPHIADVLDARECIDELFAMIQHLTGGDKAKIHEAWLEGYFKPNCPPENMPMATYEKFWHK